MYQTFQALNPLLTLAGHFSPVDCNSNLMSVCRSAIGYPAENHHIPACFSGWQCLLRCTELSDISRADAMDQCSRIVELFGMQGREHTKVGTYSKGMIQRFGLGAALIIFMYYQIVIVILAM